MRKLQTQIGRIGTFSAFFAERFIPDPWIYAIILTGVAFAAASIFTEATPLQAAIAWQRDFWNRDILTLIAQFSVNLILCTTMARAPLVQRLLIRLASLPKGAFSTIWMIAIVSILLSLISWALCIVGGALFAQEACRQAQRRGIRLHYPLAIAAGYVGMMTWGCGLTSSAALISATPGHFLENLIGIVPVSATLGSVANLSILSILLVGCPLLLASMHPEGRKIVEFSAPVTENVSHPRSRARTFADWIETSPGFLKVGAVLPVFFFVHYYFIEGKGLTIDSMNLAFLVVILLLYRTPRQMITELSRSSVSVWPIVFQFPFYAGLMGLIKTTGLGQLVAQTFADVASPWTWPTIGIASQGLVNLFIPSGGTQWIVSGEILVKTSQSLGFSNAQAVLIEVMGDQITNMIQPMWALPALALSGLRARDIMGYTAVVMIFGFAVMAAGLTFLPG